MFEGGGGCMVSYLLSHCVFACNLILTPHAKYEILKPSMIHGLVMTLLQ
jgi:hypothetical protein